MKKILVLLSLAMLAGCEPPNEFDQENSVKSAKRACKEVDAELLSLRWLPFGDVRLKATCITGSGTRLIVNPSPVYR